LIHTPGRSVHKLSEISITQTEKKIFLLIISIIFRILNVAYEQKKFWKYIHNTYIRISAPLITDKVKESRKRPGVAQRVPGSLGSQIP
jgi:hypothetical protein